ncbi:MAG: hypothetical protein ACR2MM_09355 [Flavobacteriaceae bacterium]
MERRKFVGKILAGLIITGIPSIIYGCRKDANAARNWAPEELSEICNDEKLLALGVKYRQLSGEDSPEKLTALLINDHSLSKTERRTYLEQKVVEDFRNEHVVLIDGWLLSITEARQCALISLQAQ